MRHLALAFVIFLFVLMLASVPRSHARDDGRYAGSPLKAWFDSLANKEHKACCSDADGTALSDVDWESKDGHYRVQLDGKWWDVPDEAVLDQPNLWGRTMVWPVPYWDGAKRTFQIRCFIAGAQG